MSNRLWRGKMNIAGEGGGGVTMMSTSGEP